MGYVIDTSILIDAERNRLDIKKAIREKETESFFLSVISASELLHGVHRAKDIAIRTRRSAFVEEILNRFPLLPIDCTVARIHAELWAELEKKGTIIGAHDLWIAATAIAHGLSIATGNLREFRRVPGLIVEKWE
jgi:predicted nucleic acid-binding protein